MQHQFILIIFLCLLFFSCRSGKQKETVQANTQEKIFTDSLRSESYDLTIKMNTYNLFDTSYQMVERSCMFEDCGQKWANTGYENIAQPRLNWFKIEADSLLNMMIFFENTYQIQTADDNYLKFYYEKNRKIRRAQGNSLSKPFLINSENINGTPMAYLCYLDSMKRNGDFFQYLHLNANAFIDSIKIDIYFTCWAKDCSHKADQFLEILRSVEIGHTL